MGRVLLYYHIVRVPLNLGLTGLTTNLLVRSGVDWEELVCLEKDGWWGRSVGSSDVCIENSEEYTSTLGV